MKIMILILLASQIVMGQCSYEINRVDKFTDAKELLTEEIVIARKVKRTNALPLRKVLVQLKNFDNYKTLVLKFPLTAVMSPTFDDEDAEESHLLLLLADKTKVRLPLAKLMGNQQEGVELRYATDFLLKSGDIAKLKNSLITDIRVGMKVNTFDFKVESGAAGLLQQALSCID